MKKFHKVYKAPGYPIDPKLQLEREMVQVLPNHIISGYDVVKIPDVAFKPWIPIDTMKPCTICVEGPFKSGLTLADIHKAMEILAKDVDEDSPLPPWPHGMGNIA